MSKLSLPDKTFLEAVLGMSGGYVLDLTNTSLAQLFDDLAIDIYEDKYAEYGVSKANRLRTLWKIGSNSEVASTLGTLADYIEAKQAAPGFSGFREEITDDQIARIRRIAAELDRAPSAGRGQTTSADDVAEPTPAIFTTEATVSGNKIRIEIHRDLYSHIGQYLATGDYFHAVEESYKLVRGKLREITGKEKASDIFNNSAQNTAHYDALFGKATPANDAERDFFRGIGYLHLGVQHLRNEKAHTPATPLEPNLAVHYISLASLAYDLITQFVSEDTIKELEDLVLTKRQSYRTAGAFYRDFDDGKWLQSLTLPAKVQSSAVCKVLKTKWLDEADFTRSYDHSNIVLMRLELVVDELTEADLDRLLDLPTKDSYGNDQSAGMQQFFEFVQKKYPDRMSQKTKDWLTKEQS
ncbi:TIGR02391 family protein [Micromonospora tulbaghiae]|uniref:TIGR02391 family protein n=1 Tax=Micromonospora tulbaghiae TaxID=479978 RepID=A0AAW4JFP2_9ACTN|nr:TIGR02391 family protein [Micromonospora tulbaghiae]MBO4140165.1 TIGR02391 family protein [Micromonospora tulbaghiae]